jgi:hypothetical protein
MNNAHPKVLVVGKLGYHERNITEPILRELREQGAAIHRVGGSLDFFVPDAFDEVRLSVSMAARVDASQWDVVFCVDWWNFAVPSLAWSAQRTWTPLVGICHGSVGLESDVALDVPGAKDYEAYLLSVFSEIYTHAPWVSEAVKCSESPRSICQLSPLPFPYTEQLSRVRTDRQPTKAVIYAHRWAPDKGNDVFADFAREVRRQGLPFRLIVTDEAARTDNRLDGLNVEVMPRMSQQALRELAYHVGGYAWSSARSEIAAYAVHDLISYGLHPLVSYHPAYDHLPALSHWNDVKEAARIVDGGVGMWSRTWAHITEGWRDNARNIAEAILRWTR